MSAAQSDAFFVLAQGAAGLSLFLVPRVREDGALNGLRFDRLKAKLGNRSNPTAEVELDGAHGALVGEDGRGVRAIGLFPGDIDTPLLKKRPTSPDAEALARMMRPEDVARCIAFCLDLPQNVVVEEMVVRPR